MPVRQNGGSKPAQSKDKPRKEYPEASEIPLRSVFKWASTRHNTCLTMAAEEETYEGDDHLIGEITGLQLAPMYRLLKRELEKTLAAASDDDEQAYALVCFAARCWRAGKLDERMLPPLAGVSR